MRSDFTTLPQVLVTKYLPRAVLILIFMGLNGLEATADPLNDYKHALVDYYGAEGFHPLLLPRGLRIGDVIDIKTKKVVWGQERCFPELQTRPPSTESNLPAVHLLENRAATFWVSLKYLLNFGIREEDNRQILLNLEHVSVESVGLDALLDALDEQCSDLLPIFNGNRMPTIMNRRVNVIAGILKGRANTVFSYTGGVQVEAMLEKLAKLLGNAAKGLKELAPDLVVDFGLADRVNIISRADKVQTVAYEPAVIFRPVLGGEIEDKIEVEPFNRKNKYHRDRLRNLSRAWADSPEKHE